MNGHIFYTLIGANEVDEIRKYGRAHDNCSWALGDWVRTLWTISRDMKNQILADPNRYGYKPEQINQIMALGTIDCINFVAEVSGKAVSTIKSYYAISAFYSAVARETYSSLPMSHFAWAMQFPGYAEDILAADLVLMDNNNGSPVPLRVLQALFRSDDRIPEMLDQLQDTNGIDDVLALVEYEEAEKNESVPPIVWHFFKNIKKISGYIERAVSTWDIPAEAKIEIVGLVERLNQLVMRWQLSRATVDDS